MGLGTGRRGHKHSPFAKSRAMMELAPGFDESAVVRLREMLSPELEDMTMRRGWARSFPCTAILRFTWCILAGLGPLAVAAGAPRGWLSWRGPEQTGVSRETGLPDRVSAQDVLWLADFPGQSAPVIANGKLYGMGYTGQGPDLQEGVACFDAALRHREPFH
jgi:hypothetical protein